MKELREWAKAHAAEIREDFFRFLRFPSISTDPAYAPHMESCARWLVDYIRQKTGMRAELIPTEGYSIVYAEDLRAGTKAPTLLIYGHYDVQPVDPIELWKSDPFEPTERNGKIYARGAVDDKGQIFYGLLAAYALKDRLKVNLKFCIEGEEECGSGGLSKALPRLKEKFKADALLVIDFGQFDRETPAINLGARGILTMEAVLTGSHTDLHSGIHGGLAYNPNRALVELLAKMWDAEGRVAIPHFYDDVVHVSPKEREAFAYPYEPEKYKREFGIGVLGGQKKLSMVENNCFMPTLEINGISGGYAGSGFKTVISSKAVAKISVRLVPHQDPDKVAKRIEDFLKKNVVSGMKIDVTYFGGEPAFRGNPGSKLAQAVRKAAQEVTGKECKNMLCSASIPVVAKIIREMGIDVVGMGYGLDTDDIHAPNEHFDLNRLEKGFLTVARTLELL
jgi:acetylornithine deacetylase/succinyl-diaminopimelate desuccinylase-like protein